MEKKKDALPVVVAILAILVIIAGALLVVLRLIIPMFHSKTDARAVERELQLGNKYLSEMEYDKAVTAFSEVIRIDDKNTEGYVGLADAYAGLGNWTSSVQNYDRAVVTVTGVLPDDNATREEISVLLTQTQSPEIGDVFDVDYIMDVIERRDGALESGLMALYEEDAEGTELMEWLVTVGHPMYEPEDQELKGLVIAERPAADDGQAEAAPEADGSSAANQDQNQEKTDEVSADDSVVYTPDVDSQLAVIVEHYSEWGSLIDTVTAPRSSIAITDINRNGRLEIIVSGCMGTGFFSETYVYEVDESGEGLMQCTLESDDTPDIVFKESVNTYCVDDTYYLIVNNTTRAGWSESYNIMDSVSLQDGNVIIEMLGMSHTMNSEDGSSQTLWYDQNDTEISEEEYKSIPDKIFAAGKKGTMIFKWIELASIGENTAAQLRESWDGFQYQ